jgi:hypothetical protein
MSTRVSASNLTQAAKDFAAAWQEAKMSWRDLKSMEFERAYLDKLPMDVAQTASVMEEMDALLRKVRNDCE